ncbi:hypothetical protein WA026_004163 [Henosepilachna vigintioctopunctata]|uniref:Thioredoxin domain-containing protein n=1 Tax=Henosepilachna vigintioctopunctata TaxID=420089 RepID=A0AAW1UF45_9CUCU
MSVPQAQKEGPSKKLESNESIVIDLTNESFKDGISSEEPTLILFHTTWCAACNTFKPIFKEAAKELAEKNTLRFALFDCTDAEEKLEEYNVSYVPIMKLFKKGQYECDYKDAKDLASLIKFAEKHGTPLKK